MMGGLIIAIKTGYDFVLNLSKTWKYFKGIVSSEAKRLGIEIPFDKKPENKKGDKIQISTKKITIEEARRLGIKIPDGKKK